MTELATVWGVAAKVGDVAAHYDQYGRLVGAHSFRALDLELDDDGIKITIGHDKTNEIGELVHAEPDKDGRPAHSSRRCRRTTCSAHSARCSSTPSTWA